MANGFDNFNAGLKVTDSNPLSLGSLFPQGGDVSFPARVMDSPALAQFPAAEGLLGPASTGTSVPTGRISDYCVDKVLQATLGLTAEQFVQALLGGGQGGRCPYTPPQK
jgi:hypothetical protein